MRSVLASLVCFLAVTQSFAADWWNDQYKVRHAIDINAAMLSEDLVDFPLCIRISPALCKLDQAQQFGQDARVVDATGAVLNCEIVAWDLSGIEMYVRVPSIKAGEPGQRLYLYYGNSDVTPQPASEVYDNAYRAVFHFRGDARDVSGNNVAITPKGDVTLDSTGAHFTETSGFFTVDPAALAGIGEQLTITVRFNSLENPGLQNLLSGRKTEGPEEWFNFGIKSPTIVHTNATSHGVRVAELNVDGISAGNFHTAVVRYDARNHTRAISIDGVNFQKDDSLPGHLAVNEMRIGRGVLHFEPWQFHGTLDEVRIATVARSDSWMRAEAANLADNSAFTAIGPAQLKGEPEPKPGPFTIIGPKSGTIWKKRTEPLTLTWTPSAGATSYRVSIEDIHSSIKSPKMAEVEGTELTVQPSTATPGKRAGFGDSNFRGPLLGTWTVTAINAQGEQPASSGRQLISFYPWDDVRTDANEKVTPSLNPAAKAQFDLRGYLRTRIDNAVDEYLISTPETSPAMLQVMRDRDKTPVREPLVPWAGEFAGKYLTAAQLTWRVTRDEELKQTIDKFVLDLIACRQDDGYLGPFPKSSRLTGGNWDVWGHYHCMLGLMLYYEDTQFEPALETCKKAADLLFETFGSGGPSLTNDGGGGQMNMAVAHGLVLLYKKTGVPRYLELAKYVVHEAWNDPGAGRYLEAALAGKPLIEFPQHRWEAIHDWQALAELYWLTGDEQYKKAFEHIWWSAVRGDRHNTGGLTSGEGFTGSPFNTGAIETCCTVAWIAMSIDMLRLTGDARVADEIELSTLNSALGAIPYAGRSCAYNVPMNGTRLFGVELHWQAPKGGPDLNCCSVNANRPLGMISDWALMQNAGGLALNFYGPSSLSAQLASGNRVAIEQQTDYPADGKITLRVTPEKAETFTLNLRIPRWSEKTIVSVDGAPVNDVKPGTYLAIDRQWNGPTTIVIELDFTPHFWAGAESFANTASFYRGPILYAYDARYNTLNPSELPAIDPATAQFTPATFDGTSIPPWIFGSVTAANGTTIHVVDLSSAGQTGNQYVTWLPVSQKPERDLLAYP